MHWQLFGAQITMKITMNDDDEPCRYFDEDLWCWVYEALYDDDEECSVYDDDEPCPNSNENEGEDGKRVYLCEECARYVSERLDEIQKNIKERSVGKKPFKDIGRRPFKDSWLKAIIVLLFVGFFYGMVVYNSFFEVQHGFIYDLQLIGYFMLN